MDFAVYILVVFSVVILSAQGKPYYVVNGPEREQDNNYIARANEKTVRTRFLPRGEWVKIKNLDASSVTVAAGSPVVITCEVLGGPPPKVFWLHANENLEKEVAELERQSSPKKKSSMLSTVISRYVIDCATPEHHNTGVHCASIVDGTVQLSEEIKIFVNGSNTMGCSNQRPPIITSYAQVTVAEEDSTVEFPCRAVGNPPPETFWTFKDTSESVESDNVKVLADGTLVFNRLSWEDMNAYVCNARNAHGETRVESFIYPAAKPKAGLFNDVQMIENN